MRYLLFAVLLAGPVAAAPIVPNFKTGTTTSHTESKTYVTEKIHSVDFATGYTYSASGTNITTDKSVVPSAMPTQTQTVEGVKSSWTGLDLEAKPAWTLVTPGEAFQFTETYNGPGLQTVTDITRTTTIESVTDTTSVFGP